MREAKQAGRDDITHKLARRPPIITNILQKHLVYMQLVGLPTTQTANSGTQLAQIKF